jgi:hypothetical protein
MMGPAKAPSNIAYVSNLIFTQGHLKTRPSDKVFQTRLDHVQYEPSSSWLREHRGK